jgi:hypothetical protein
MKVLNSHEYYVSVTTIEYAKPQQSLQIISQIFIDDFEHVLQQRYDETVVLNDHNKSELVDVYISRYLKSKLKLWVNEKPVEFNFIGKEYKEDIVYCYLEVKDISLINSVKIKNTLLFDFFEEQQNIVRMKINDKNKSYLLVSDNDNCMLNFD